MRRQALLVAAAIVVAAAPLYAQPFAYVTVLQGDACADPAYTPPCRRGLINVVNGAGAVVATVAVWQGLSASAAAFGDAAVNPAGTHLYVARIFPGSPGRSPQPATTTFIAFDTARLTETSAFTVIGSSGEMAFSRDGSRLFVARNVLASDVAVIDTATNQEVATIPALFPRDVLVSPRDGRLYVVENNNTISVRDGTSYAFLQSIDLGGFPSKAKISPDGAHVYVVRSDARVLDIDTTTNTVAAVMTQFGGAGDPHDVTFARGRAYVTASMFSPGVGPGENIAVFDLATRELVTTIPVVYPLWIEATGDESRVFAVSDFDGLETVDTSGNQVIARRRLTGPITNIATSPASPFGALVIDTPASGARVEQPFDIGGWAVDVVGFGGGPGVDAIHVWAYPATGGSPIFVGVAEYGRARPDISALVGMTYEQSGYRLTVRGLAPGAYTLVVYGRSTRTGAFTLARALPVTILRSVRLMIDTPIAGGPHTPLVPSLMTLPFDIAGWAIDAAATSGTGIDAVHVWAFPARPGASPIKLGTATLGEPRPDVAALYGPQFAQSGYRFTVTHLSRFNAEYIIQVLAHQASALPDEFAASQAFRVRMWPVVQYLFIDTPAADATVPNEVTIAGWAAEVNTAGAAAGTEPPGTGVDLIHVWATPALGGTPIFMGAATYGISRPDVAAFLGSRYLATGYTVTAPLAPGRYFISVYARSTSSNTFERVRVVTVTVQ